MKNRCEVRGCNLKYGQGIIDCKKLCDWHYHLFKTLVKSKSFFPDRKLIFKYFESNPTPRRFYEWREEHMKLIRISKGDKRLKKSSSEPLRMQNSIQFFGGRANE